MTSFEILERMQHGWELRRRGEYWRLSHDGDDNWPPAEFRLPGVEVRPLLVPPIRIKAIGRPSRDGWQRYVQQGYRKDRSAATDANTESVPAGVNGSAAPQGGETTGRAERPTGG